MTGQGRTGQDKTGQGRARCVGELLYVYILYDYTAQRRGEHGRERERRST